MKHKLNPDYFLCRYRERFLAYLKAAGYTQETCKTYEGDLRAFLVWAEEQNIQELSEFTPEVLRDYEIFLSLRPSDRANREGRKERGLAASTRAHHIACLKKLFEFLKESGFLLTDPATALKSPRTTRRLPANLLTPDEVLRMLAVIDDSLPRGMRDRAALELTYSTGIRSGELTNLKLDDVRLPESLIKFVAKGGKERLLPVGKEARLCLDRYLRLGRSKMGRERGDYFFVSPTKGGMSRKEINVAFRAYVKAAGIEKYVTMHSLRHSCATHLLAGGADIRHIQELLGHSCLQTTQLYTRLETQDLAGVLRRYHPREQGFE